MGDLNVNIRKGIRIIVDSFDVDVIPGLNLTNQGHMAVAEAIDWLEDKAYQEELVDMYSTTNYDPWGGY